jgi:nucleotidyltransferase substrate binding protein (TIGR01987 family)
MQRFDELRADVIKALTRLQEALGEDITKSTTIIDGVIQRFEFTFELSWKLAKAVLEYNGIEASTPRAVIKEAYKAKMVKDGQAWIDMLEDRNKTSHIYDEAQALEIYNKIKNNHYATLKAFIDSAVTDIKNI